jgi:hypothetical protein
MMAKHKAPRVPRWAKPNPGAGKHGIPDKGAAKAARQFDKANEKAAKKQPRTTNE